MTTLVKFNPYHDAEGKFTDAVHDVTGASRPLLYYRLREAMVAAIESPTSAQTQAALEASRDLARNVMVTTGGDLSKLTMDDVGQLGTFLESHHALFDYGDWPAQVPVYADGRTWTFKVNPTNSVNNVFIVIDEQTGTKQIIKTLGYFPNEPMGEIVGYGAGRSLGLPVPRVVIGTKDFPNGQGYNVDNWAAFQWATDAANEVYPPVGAGEPMSLAANNYAGNDLDWPSVTALDIAIGNGDRHRNNVMLVSSPDYGSRLVPIDNGGGFRSGWDNWGYGAPFYTDHTAIPDVLGSDMIRDSGGVDRFVESTALALQDLPTSQELRDSGYLDTIPPELVDQDLLDQYDKRVMALRDPYAAQLSAENFVSRAGL